MRLRKPCEHDRYEEHPIGADNDVSRKYPLSARWCPGGEFLPEDAKTIWWCERHEGSGHDAFCCDRRELIHSKCRHVGASCRMVEGYFVTLANQVGEPG